MSWQQLLWGFRGWGGGIVPGYRFGAEKLHNACSEAIVSGPWPQLTSAEFRCPLALSEPHISCTCMINETQGQAAIQFRDIALDWSLPFPKAGSPTKLFASPTLSPSLVSVKFWLRKVLIESNAPCLPD